jgi:hypothetical protein
MLSHEKPPAVNRRAPQNQAPVRLQARTTCASWMLLALVLLSVPVLKADLWYRDFYYTTNSSGAQITGYFGSGGPVTIPDSINDLPVTSIGSAAFNYQSLTSVTIPNSVTSIGQQAFYYCSSLTSVTIPNGVTNMGGQVFYSCTRYDNVTIL